MRKNRVLIAAEALASVEFLEICLENIDCETDVATDGLTTLDKVATFQPDLVLLDISMSPLSGPEVCRKIKADPATAGVKILVATPLDDPTDIERAVAAGCDDFFGKPFNRLEVIMRVENMLRQRPDSGQ